MISRFKDGDILLAGERNPAADFLKKFVASADIDFKILQVKNYILADFLLQHHNIKLLLIASPMPEVALEYLSSRYPLLPKIVVTTELPELKETMRLIDLGADDFLIVPCSPQALYEKLQLHAGFPQSKAGDRLDSEQNYPDFLRMLHQLRQLPTLKSCCNMLVTEAMARTGNHQKHASELLGISPQALSCRLKNMQGISILDEENFI